MRNTAIFVNKIELKKNDGVSSVTNQLSRIPRDVPRDKGLYPVNIFIHGITFGLSRYSPSGVGWGWGANPCCPELHLQDHDSNSLCQSHVQHRPNRREPNQHIAGT